VTDEIAAFRAQELLLKRATEGLDEAETRELATLGVDHDVSYDLAAAAVDIATIQLEQMPAGVADKILVAAGAAARPQQAAPTTLAGVGLASLAPRPSAQIAAPPEATVTPIRKPSRASMIVAYLAAAACLVLAVGAVLWARRQEPTVITQDRIVIEPVASAAERRAELLAAGGDVTTLAWTATADDASKTASGDVVWSPSKQQGYMRFVGLAPNDPSHTQYQLWIFDKERNQEFPVDGGVFDVSSTGEVIVPISAKLRVGDAVLFAVTVEKPGGVVVSKRERIVVTAAPPKTG
jgi:anti-sigma-K factor RskA